MAMVECGLDVFLQTDMQAIRRKSLALTDRSSRWSKRAARGCR
jgi:kynureninase